MEYGAAAPLVKELAEIEGQTTLRWTMDGGAHERYRKKHELIQIICREYPEAANELGLHEQYSQIANPNQATPLLPQARQKVPSRTKAQQCVKLGRGGIVIKRDGERTFAPRTEWNQKNLKASYKFLCAELPKVSSIVKVGKNRGKKISVEELQRQFKRSVLARAADKGDWNDWISAFSEGGRPKSVALVYLEQKTGLKRSAIKSYLSRKNKHPQQ
jgi:hypothetical protein